MTEQSGVDVVVIGGGPVGVVASILLARRGMTVRVLERATEVYDLPRAIVMDAEIQRILASAGLGEELRAITTPLAGAEFVATDGTRIIGRQLDPTARHPLGFPPSVTFYQPELEEMLRGGALDAGVDLRLGVEVTSVADEPDHVVIAASDGTHLARWAVAADGASSPTRKALGIAFVDQGFDQDWLVLDVRLRRPVPSLPRFVQQICDPERPTTYVVGHADYRRWEFQLQPGETREEMTNPDRVWELLQPWLGPDDAELVRAVVYRFHATVAETMRAGRLFLAGDAAHQMPPFLGQGLCSGVRDAANLAWKLQMTHEGRAGDTLLDTYDEERRPHAAGVVAHAVDTGRLIDELSGRTERVTGLDAAYGGSRSFPTLDHGLRVGTHPSVGRQLPQPVVSGRPLDEVLGRRFAIVVADGPDPLDPEPAASAWDDLAVVVHVPSDALDESVPGGGAAIVRPDRYVAAVAETTDQLLQASADLLRTITGSS